MMTWSHSTLAGFYEGSLVYDGRFFCCFIFTHFIHFHFCSFTKRLFWWRTVNHGVSLVSLPVMVVGNGLISLNGYVHHSALWTFVLVNDVRSTVRYKTVSPPTKQRHAFFTGCETKLRSKPLVPPARSCLLSCTVFHCLTSSDLLFPKVQAFLRLNPPTNSFRLLSKYSQPTLQP